MERMTKEELKKELGKLKDFKLYVFEGEVYVKAEDYKEKAIENKKLKKELGEYKKMFEDQLKEVYIKNTAKFLDKKFPKINGFIEEDTLQELRDLGEI